MPSAPEAHTPSPLHSSAIGLLVLLAGLCAFAFAWAGLHPAAITVGLAAAATGSAAGLYRREVGRRAHRQQQQIDQLAARERELMQAVARLRQSRESAEEDLRAAEARYLAALRGSQDGLWEWELASGRVELSARWKSMLGFEPRELGHTQADWLGRVHTDDRPALQQAIDRHLAGTDGRFDHEMRLLHKDGSIRWVLSRGVAIRRASGAPYRMVGLDTDVTRLKRMETVLDAVAHGTAGAFGERFFSTLVQHFARALDVRCAFITECADQPPTRLRTLAFWIDDGFKDNFEYELPGTPCEQVVNESRNCFIRTGVGTQFPREAGFEAYLGMPIVASDGLVLGHLAFLHTTPLGNDLLIDSIYRIFLSRAAAEMERCSALARLQRELQRGLSYRM
jgi:PAS domain S-box-containing protein